MYEALSYSPEVLLSQSLAEAVARVLRFLCVPLSRLQLPRQMSNRRITTSNVCLSRCQGASNLRMSALLSMRQRMTYALTYADAC